MPVTDMLRFHKFTVGHFWISEYGCSEEKGNYDFLIKTSPLHNIKKQHYPAMLITTADHDDRVVPLHTYKYVAELQYQVGQLQMEAGKTEAPILARINKNAGHGSGKPTKMIIQEEADIFGFIAKITGTKWQK